MLHTTEIRAELLRRQDDGQWPDDPSRLRADDVVRPESIGIDAPPAAFYRTSGVPARSP